MGRPVPDVHGGVLGHQPHLPPLQHLLGQVGVLHIHEVSLVEAAGRLEGAGPHGGKAAGAELDLPGPRQVLPGHDVGVVVLFEEGQKAQLPVDHRPQAAPPQGQHLHPPVREAQARPGHHRRRVGLHPFGQVREGVLPQQDIGVEDKVVVAGQLGQHGVVPGPKAHVLFLADDPDGLPGAGGQFAAGRRCFQGLAGAVGAGVVHKVEGQGVAAGVFQHRDGGPYGLGLVVIGHDRRRQVQNNVLPLLYAISPGVSA